jgi:AraC family transcriptional regulator, regulatory protein of adaptative response / methylated-DNA-[protein]-cysteine methyltransferase
MITTIKINTELGTMIAGTVDEGLCLLEFNKPERLNKEVEELKNYFKTDIQEGENTLLEKTKRELLEYFNGTRREFTLPLVTFGTSFRKSVWEELLRIQYGTTRSYMEQSIALGSPASIRAVANANGMNRISIIIPCHRVIGSDGSLTGYGGGIERKRWLLEHEKKHSGKAHELSLF